jgi:hypothetical protein
LKPVRDAWMLEELIMEDPTGGLSARNLKFYTFYGEVLFVQETRHEPERGVTFWSPQGKSISTGRYDELNFSGIGVTEAQLQMVQKISLEIPCPFMRIDMLLSNQGLVFGEFTPRPGKFQEFNAEWDRRMAESWVCAEGRIVYDLIAGKQFRAFAETARAKHRKSESQAFMPAAEGPSRMSLLRQLFRSCGFICVSTPYLLTKRGLIGCFNLMRSPRSSSVGSKQLRKAETSGACFPRRE